MARDYSVNIIINAADKASSVLGGIGSNVQALGKVALGLGGAAVAGVGALGAGLTKLAVDAAPLQGIEEAFYGIAEASGESGDKMLAALQKGSAGMITQRDLMEKYNLAAQLVGTQFANELPNAMQYLGKVSAATGQDMGFMMDSLVRGVGRLSPMILDNLGVQVDLTTANEAYAAQIGKTVSELTKQEQQAALMAQVMEKLAENTAAMPDVAGSAAQGIAALGVKFQDLKDRVGLAVLPVLTKGIEVLTKVADVVLPLVVPAIEKLAEALLPLVEKGGQLVDVFLGALQAGEGLGGALQSLAETFLSMIGVSDENIAKIMEFITTASDLAGQVIDWVTQFVSWKDVLIALGIAIAAVVIPAIVSIVSAAAPVIAVGAALVAAVALVRNAWESNWLGIRDVVGAVANFISGTVWPLIQQALDFLRTNIVPPLQAAIETLWTRAKEFWNGFWSTFGPALQSMYARLGEFWDQIQPKLMEAWQALNDLWNVVVTIWREQLQPALNKLAEALGLSGGKADEMGSKVGALAGLLLKIGLEALINGIVVAVEAFVAVVEAVARAMEWWNDTINKVKEGLSGLQLPDWLTPGSPAPLQLAIEGITKAMRDWNAMSLGQPILTPAMAMAGVGGSSNVATTTNNYFNMTVNTRATTSTVRQDFQTMRAIWGGK